VNIHSVSQTLLDEKLTAVRLEEVANKAQVGIEVVKETLGIFREEVVKEIKKKDVKLSLSFGWLILRTKGTIEFKAAD
jgi:sRNA-binding carbon storage regulator CsrA